ncbi:MAG TPA: D-aminoacylase [Acidimicrobiia bacterium]|nr:D-aminoacylase [Acidimicrobiia bacterium]
MPDVDIRIDGATIVDGTGADPRAGSVGVRDGRLVVPADGASTRRVIDAAGAVVSPGFIDLHSHADFSLPAYPGALAAISQGVTTLVTGNCGFSPFPCPPARSQDIQQATKFIDQGLDWERCATAADFLDYVDSTEPACNVALQVGLGTVRLAAMGFDRREATEAETETMRDAVAAAFTAGVVGVSSGLVYAPGTYAPSHEVARLVAVAAAHGGFYSTHIRNEGPSLLEAMEEAIVIASSAGVALQLSHHKALGRANWGSVVESLARIDSARDAGIDVSADAYPYRAGSTGLTQILPARVLEGGVQQMQRMLDDPVERERIRHEILAVNAPREFDPAGILLACVPEGPNKPFEGRYLADIAAELGSDPLDTALTLIAEEAAGITMVVFGMSEADVRRVLAHRAVAVASDGWTLDPGAAGMPHPRNYGTFTRVLGHYVRDEGVLTLPAAIHKMTQMPAQRLGWTRRGVLRDGGVADLVVLDPTTVADRATFADPHQLSAGITHVFVGGRPVFEEGEPTGLRPGRVSTLERRSDPIE